MQGWNEGQRVVHSGYSDGAEQVKVCETVCGWHRANLVEVVSAGPFRRVIPR